MKFRFPKLARWLAGIYLAWSLLIFFGTLGSNGHQWWSLFLYFIIWPVSWLYEFGSAVCLDALIPGSKPTPDWVWTLNDYVAGAFYIILGTLWIWFLGRLISRLATQLFPIKKQETEPIRDDVANNVR